MSVYVCKQEKVANKIDRLKARIFDDFNSLIRMKMKAIHARNVAHCTAVADPGGGRKGRTPPPYFWLAKFKEV